jgi:hypothetical protein
MANFYRVAVANDSDKDAEFRVYCCSPTAGAQVASTQLNPVQLLDPAAAPAPMDYVSVPAGCAAVRDCANPAALINQGEVIVTATVFDSMASPATANPVASASATHKSVSGNAVASVVVWLTGSAGSPRGGFPAVPSTLELTMLVADS